MIHQVYRGSAGYAYLTSYCVWMLLYGILLYYWFDLTLLQAAADSSVHTVLLAALGLLLSHNLAYYRPVAAPTKYGYIILLTMVKSAIWVMGTRWMLSKMFETEDQYLTWLNTATPVLFVVGWLLLTGTGFKSLMLYEAEERREENLRKQTSEKIVREAELYKLRQQLQPHFLFNSLNSINALITIRPQQAREMVLKLSDFLRGSLKREDEQWISLPEELQYLALYLDIEKVRFGHRLSTTVEQDETASRMMLPPMLLQPVVENAIKFGLYDTTEAITISISAQAVDNTLYITITNPFDPSLQHPNKGTGFGLTSIRRRLYLLFARQDLLETSVNDNIFTTLIKVPQTHDKSSHN